MKTRAALLVAWTHAYLDGQASVEQVVSALESTDEAVDFHSDTSSARSVRDVLASWTADGWGRPRLVLPVPGDPRGLPGPGAWTDLALRAGEAVVTTHAVLVPQVAAYGNSVEGFTYLTTWEVLRTETGLTDPARSAAAPVPSVRDAELAVRATMVESVAALAALNRSRWSPELADAIDDIRTLRRNGEPFASSLPELYSPQARELVARAIVIDRIVAIAEADDGLTLTVHELNTRRAALAALSRAVREAMCAAVNEPLEQSWSESAPRTGVRSARMDR